MKELTQEQAIAFYESGVWVKWTGEQLVAFQLWQPLLCIPYSIYRELLEKVLGRGVQTVEVGLNRRGLQDEYLCKHEQPNMQIFIDLLPEDKKYLLTSA